ncbi:MAG: hypothetical protein IKO16_07125 [Lachnospiraceae bacterium]|nr:hypothetical protein [Lachnospiraceae bacterium]
MAAIALYVLKITGIVLASLLALVLIILALVLFVPIRYRIKASKNDPRASFTASAAVTYLLHIISGKFIYDEEVRKYVRVFGIRVWPKKEKVHVSSEQFTAEHANDHTVNNVDTVSGSAPDTVTAQDYTVDWNEDDATASAGEDPDPDDEDSFACKFERIADAIAGKYNEYNDKLESAKKKVRYWDKMVNDERNKKAAELIYDRVVRLLKKIAPKKIKGYVHFGFEDPALVGQIIAWLSIFYPVLPRKLSIDPSFSDQDLYGQIDIKGNLALISVATCFCRLYFDRDCRRLWRLYKKHSK